MLSASCIPELSWTFWASIDQKLPVYPAGFLKIPMVENQTLLETSGGSLCQQSKPRKSRRAQECKKQRATVHPDFLLNGSFRHCCASSTISKAVNLMSESFSHSPTQLINNLGSEGSVMSWFESRDYPNFSALRDVWYWMACISLLKTHQNLPRKPFSSILNDFFRSDNQLQSCCLRARIST